jgi:hypothetical protein
MMQAPVGETPIKYGEVPLRLNGFAEKPKTQIPHRLKRLRKKSDKQTPHRLEAGSL